LQNHTTGSEGELSGQLQVQVGGEVNLRRGEAADSGQSRVGQALSLREMGSRVEELCEKDAKPPQAGLRKEDLILKVNRDATRCLIAPGGPPVD